MLNRGIILHVLLSFSFGLEEIDVTFVTCLGKRVATVQVPLYKRQLGDAREQQYFMNCFDWTNLYAENDFIKWLTAVAQESPGKVDLRVLDAEEKIVREISLQNESGELIFHLPIDDLSQKVQIGYAGSQICRQLSSRRLVEAQSSGNHPPFAPPPEEVEVTFVTYIGETVTTAQVPLYTSIVSEGNSRKQYHCISSVDWMSNNPDNGFVSWLTKKAKETPQKVILQVVDVEVNIVREIALVDENGQQAFFLPLDDLSQRVLIRYRSRFFRLLAPFKLAPLTSQTTRPYHALIR